MNALTKISLGGTEEKLPEDRLLPGGDRKRPFSRSRRKRYLYFLSPVASCSLSGRRCLQPTIPGSRKCQLLRSDVLMSIPLGHYRKYFCKGTGMIGRIALDVPPDSPEFPSFDLFLSLKHSRFTSLHQTASFLAPLPYDPVETISIALLMRIAVQEGSLEGLGEDLQTQ